jgi:hypothetical protein
MAGPDAGGGGGGKDAGGMWLARISDATFYIYGRVSRGKKVAGPGVPVIICKHLSAHAAALSQLRKL